jgi:zinc D-Ala-D-Ala carboxypeptidase
MDMFMRKELIKADNGYTLVLYIEKQNSEFAEEIFGRSGKKNKKSQEDFLENIKRYISNNYDDIKIDTVKIMAGSILIATIGYGAMNFESISSSFNTNQGNAQSNPGYSVNVDEIGQKKDTEETELASPSDISNNEKVDEQQSITQEKKDIYDEVKDNLILANKNNALSPNYVPGSLVNPNVPSLNRAKTKMTPEAAKALEALFQKAKKDNIKLTAISGYRSYQLQDAIFASNTKKYQSAEAANQFSARPGQSEHQTGLAMDVSTSSVNFQLIQSFAQTKEGQWLKENAPKFGFIVRYPKGKENITGYQFEPWHLRYVGIDAALEISERNITLEEYLGRF